MASYNITMKDLAVEEQQRASAAEAERARALREAERAHILAELARVRALAEACVLRSKKHWRPHRAGCCPWNGVCNCYPD